MNGGKQAEPNIESTMNPILPSPLSRHIMWETLHGSQCPSYQAELVAAQLLVQHVSCIEWKEPIKSRRKDYSSKFNPLAPNQFMS